MLVLVAWFAVGVGLPASAAEPPARSYVSGFGSCVVMAGWLRPGRLPPGCVATAGFHNRDAVVSPDGNIFYSVGGWDGLSTLRVFHRNPGTGLLAPAGGRFGFRIDPATGAVTGLCCSPAPRAVSYGTDVAISPDGRTLYVASAVGTGHGWR